MGVLLTFVGCFILYGKSRYFPAHLSKIGDWMKGHVFLSRVTAYLTFGLAIFLFSNLLGWGTGTVAFLITLGFAYALLLVILPLNKGYIYLMTGLFLTTIILEYTL